MGEYTATAALREALRDRRRNAGALLFALVVLAAATLVGTKIAYYAAALLVFATWMAWFVLTGIEWIERADF